MIQNGVRFDNWHSVNDGGVYTLSDSIGYPEPINVNDDISINTMPYVVKYGNRELDFTFIIPDTGDWQRYYNAISRQIEGKICNIVRDIEPDYTYVGLCTMDKVSSTEREGTIGVKVIAQPYKYGPRVTKTFLQSDSTINNVLFNVEGDQITPAVITVNPSTALQSLTMTGAARNQVTGDPEPIVIKNISKNYPVIIDGEKHIVTQFGNNKYPETDFWEYPTLVPGNNHITLSNLNLDLSIAYTPRYI